MSIFGSQFMDFFSAGPKRSTSDDAFLDVLKSHPDIFKEAFLSNCIICCPVSASLGNEFIAKEHVMSHVLVPGRIPGEFISISGQHVHISGNYLVCGVGFKEARKVKIVNVGSLADNWGKSISIYYVHRPLVGGVNAPEDIDEMSTALMLKYIGTLRSYTVLKPVFVTLDDYIREMKVLGRMSSLDGFNKILPSLSAALKAQWSRACDRISRGDGIAAMFGNGDEEKAKEHISQIIESYIMHSLVEFIYPWLCKRVDHGETSIHNLMEGIHLCTQSDLGVAPEFQTNQSDAIRELCTVAEAQTPVEKMLVFTKVINLIREAIDMVVSKKFPSAEVEFATDDLVCVLIWVIIQAYPHYRLIVVDLLYCKEFHFCNSSRTQLGYNLCHIEVAVSWFTRRAAVRKPVLDLPSVPSSMLNHQLIEDSDNERRRSQDENVDDVKEESLTVKLISDLDHARDEMMNAPSATEDVWPSLLVPDNLRANLLWVQRQLDELPHTPTGKSLFEDSKDSLNSTEELGISVDKNSATSVEALVEAVATAAPDSPTKEAITRPHKRNSERHGKHFVVLDIHSKDVKATNFFHILSEDTNKPDVLACTAGFGDYFAALTASGNPYTWGRPDCGRLGRGVTNELDFFFPVRTPAPVTSLSSFGKVRQLSCGKGHMMAVTDSGEIYVWGDNRCGQLGLFDLSVKASNRSSRNGALSAVTELAVSSELAMVQATGPTLLAAMAHIKVISVACGAHHSLCLGVDGNVYSWGRAANGRLGQLSEKSHTAEHLMGRPGPVKSRWQPSAPITLVELNNLKPSWSESSSRGISMSPSMANLHGGVAGVSGPATTKSPTSARSLSPGVAPPPAVSKVTFITAGFNYSVAVTNCGAVFTWGSGTYGALGHGSHCDEFLPRQVMSLRFPGAPIVSASANHHTLFLSSNGLVFGCGLNNKKQVNSLPEVSSKATSSKIDRDSVLVARPIEIFDSSTRQRSLSDPQSEDKLSSSSSSSAPLTKIKSVSCGDFHSAVLTTDNRILLWGDGELRGPITPANGLIAHRHEHSFVDDASRGPQSGSFRDVTGMISTEKQIKQVVCSGESVTVLVD